MAYTSLLNELGKGRRKAGCSSSKEATKLRKQQLRISFGKAKIRGKVDKTVNQVSFYIGRKLLEQLGIKNPMVEPNRLDVLFDPADGTGIIRLRKDGLKVFAPGLSSKKSSSWSFGVLRLRGLSWIDSRTEQTKQLEGPLVLEQTISPENCGGTVECELLFELPAQILWADKRWDHFAASCKVEARAAGQVVAAGEWRD